MKIRPGLLDHVELRVVALLCFAAIRAGLAGCSRPADPSDAKDNPKRVVTTFTILADIAQNVAGGLGLFKDIAQTRHKVVPVLVVLENLTALDTAYNDMMQRTGRIYAGSSWHA
jgi:hypothetical protein